MDAPGGCMSMLSGLLMGLVAAVIAPLLLMFGIDESMIPPELREMIPLEMFGGEMMPPDYYDDFEFAVPAPEESFETLPYVGTPDEQALMLLQAISEQRYADVEAILCPSDYESLLEQTGVWTYENASCQTEGDVVTCTADIYRDGSLLSVQLEFSFVYDGVYLCTAD